MGWNSLYWHKIGRWCFDPAGPHFAQKPWVTFTCETSLQTRLSVSTGVWLCWGMGTHCPCYLVWLGLCAKWKLDAHEGSTYIAGCSRAPGRKSAGKVPASSAPEPELFLFWGVWFSRLNSHLADPISMSGVQPSKAARLLSPAEPGAAAMMGKPVEGVFF